MIIRQQEPIFLGKQTKKNIFRQHNPNKNTRLNNLSNKTNNLKLKIINQSTYKLDKNRID